MSDVQNLAVPFALILAKQGLQGLFEDNNKSNIGVSVSPKKSVKKGGNAADVLAVPTATKVKRGGNAADVLAVPTATKVKRGGACMSCQGNHNTTLAGGNKKETLKESYANLAQRIDQFLSKY